MSEARFYSGKVFAADSYVIKSDRELTEVEVEKALLDCWTEARHTMEGRTQDICEIEPESAYYVDVDLTEE